MKKLVQRSIFVLVAGFVFLTGCGNNANVTVTPTQEVTVENEPRTRLVTLEMVHQGACAIAGAFVEDKISAERASDELAGVANEITKAVDSLHVSKKKKKNLVGAIGKKSEEDGMCVLEGDIQDLRMYLSDYISGETDKSVVIKMINNIAKTDYTKFNK